MEFPSRENNSPISLLALITSPFFLYLTLIISPKRGEITLQKGKFSLQDGETYPTKGGKGKIPYKGKKTQPEINIRFRFSAKTIMIDHDARILIRSIQNQLINVITGILSKRLLNCILEITDHVS